MRKRLLSALLAGCLLATLLPPAALAAEEHAHDEGSFTAWTETTSLPTEAGCYYLAADVTLTGTWTVPSGDNTLCLNGHSVTCDSANAVTVPAGASLTVSDCQGGGKVACTSGSDYAVYVREGGTFILESGGVEHVDYRGIFNGNYGASGRVKLLGGAVTGGTYAVCNYYSSSELYLSGEVSLTGGTADVYTDGSSSYICADDGGEADPVAYRGAPITLAYYSSYLTNGYQVVHHATADTLDKFTLKNENYELVYDADYQTLKIQGKPQTMTWYGIDGAPLSGEDYPATLPYDTDLHASDLPAGPAVEGKIFLGWLYRRDGDTSWSQKCWSGGTIYEPTAFKAVYADAFPGGTGTESDPYQIAAADDLAKLRTIVDSGNTTYNSGGVWYQLTADIDLAGLCGPDAGSWTPIGGGSYPFRANLDGNGRTVSNLYLGGGRYDSYQGLFGYLKGEYSGQTTVKALTLADVSVSSGGSYIGALAGRALYVNITGCAVTGAVSGESDYGALVGKDDGGGTLENNDVSGVALSPYGYTVDENRTMAYQVSGSKSTTIDIKGSYKGSWLKTTYSDEGYAVATSGLDSATVTAEADFVNGGKYIRLSYTVTAGDTAVSGGKLAIHADVKIGENDQAAVEAIQDAAGQVIGLKMVDDKAASSSCDAQFNLYLNGTGGVTAVDAWWFGYYSDRYSHYYDQLTDSTRSSGTYETNDDGVYTRLSGVDSGFAVSWQNIDLAANESATFSFILGVGEKADPPAWSAENAVTLTLAAEAAQNDRLVDVAAKVQDANGLTDTLYYNVDGGEETALDSVAADGTQKDITGQLDLSGYALGQYTFSFWVVNSKGAASPSVERTVTVTADGIEGLDAAPSAPEHSHRWAETWSKNKTHHWHECEAEGCDVTENSGKEGYGEHSWNSGEVTTQPTCTEKGVKTYACTVCTATKTEDIDPTGHDYGGYQHDAAQHWRACAVCEAETEKEAHVFDDEQDTTCDTCGYTRTVTPVEPDPVEPDPVEPTPGHSGGGYVAPRAVVKKTRDTTDTADNPCPKDETCPIAKFTDASTTAWYHDGVHYCVENGLMVGTSETTFEPETTTSRAMIATILWRQEGSPAVNYALAYDDVKPDTWYTEAVRWATAQGVVNGYGNGTFGPNDPITREQLAVMLYRYKQFQGGGFTGNWMFLLDFTDRNQVSQWAYEAVCYMTMHGVMEGKESKALDPQGNATRFEATAMLQRFCEMALE